MTLAELYCFRREIEALGAQTMYANRTVKSYYYDTLKLDMYHESEEGVLPRKKIRLRTYGSNTEFNVEEKVSSVEGRFKVVKPHGLQTASDKIPTSMFDKAYGLLTPSIFIYYQRSYLKLCDLRITLDWDIRYQSLRCNRNSVIIDEFVVAEIKTSIAVSSDLIANFVDMPTSRFSKYSRGVAKTMKILT